MPSPPTRAGLERRAVTQLGIAAFFLLFALPQSCIVGDNPEHAAALPAWPSAPGTITESRSDPGGHDGSGPYHIVGYAFVVDGRARTGDRVTFDVTGADEEEVAARLKRYPVGKRVDVRYDPDDPSVCALEAPRYTFGDQVLIKGVPALYGLAALFIALAATSAWRSTRA